MLLNVARGGILDEQDVADALTAGRIAGRRRRRVRGRAADGLAAARRARTRCSRRTSARRRRRPRSRSPRRSPSRSSRSSTGGPARYAVNAPLLTPETAQAIAPYLPLAETLGRFLGQFAHAAPRTLTLEIAGEPAAYDASPLVAAVLRGLLETSTTERVNLVNAATMARARGHQGRRAQDARPPAPFSSLLTRDRPRPTGSRRPSPAPSPTASRTSSGSTSTRWTWRRRTRC